MSTSANERGSAWRRTNRAVLVAAALIVSPAIAEAQRTIACAGASAAAGQARAQPSLLVTWLPATPRAGTLFRISARHRVDGARARRTGENSFAALTSGAAAVAGEPIHFRFAGDSIVALAAVPIDSTNGIKLALRCESGDTLSIRIPTQAGNYRLEKLRVAPRFSAPPDSALAARMRREADEAAAVSRGAHETPRMWTASFIAPRTSRVTSGFGSGRTFNGTVTSPHMGTDFAGTIGAPVRASNRGIVRLVGAFYLGGNVIYLDHGDGVVTAYLHLSRQLVQVGDTVARGAIIGNVGATGRVTGPHLHLITRYGTITVDPASLFSQR